MRPHYAPGVPVRFASTPALTVIFALALALCGIGCPSFTASEEPSFQPDDEPPARAKTVEVRRPGDGEEPQVRPPPPRPQPPAPTPVAPPTGAPRDSIAARHVLVMYVGSMRAPPNVTRTQAEARARAEDVLRRARRPGADFAALAREFSDEPGASER